MCHCKIHGGDTVGFVSLPSALLRDFLKDTFECGTYFDVAACRSRFVN